MSRPENERSFADRRAEADAPQDDEPDFAEESTPSPTDPPTVEDDGVGGSDGRYEPPSRA